MKIKDDTAGASKTDKAVQLKNDKIGKKKRVGGANVSKAEYKKTLQKVLSPVCSDDEEEENEVEQEELHSTESDEGSQNIEDGDIASTQTPTTPIQF